LAKAGYFAVEAKVFLFEPVPSVKWIFTASSTFDIRPPRGSLGGGGCFVIAIIRVISAICGLSFARDCAARRNLP
jgi:hypothetical protein